MGDAMKKSFLVIFSFLLISASMEREPKGSDVIQAPAASSLSRPQPGVKAEMVQAVAGGHVLGFKKGEMFVASRDHALRVEYVNARSIFPANEGASSDAEGERQAVKPLGKVSYRNLWDGVSLVYERDGSGDVKSTYDVQPAGRGAVDRVDQIRLR
jgi:hypothetical protein